MADNLKDVVGDVEKKTILDEPGFAAILAGGTWDYDTLPYRPIIGALSVSLDNDGDGKPETYIPFHTEGNKTVLLTPTKAKEVAAGAQDIRSAEGSYDGAAYRYADGDHFNKDPKNIIKISEDDLENHDADAIYREWKEPDVSEKVQEQAFYVNDSVKRALRSNTLEIEKAPDLTIIESKNEPAPEAKEPAPAPVELSETFNKKATPAPAPEHEPAKPKVEEPVKLSETFNDIAPPVPAPEVAPEIEKPKIEVENPTHGTFFSAQQGRVGAIPSEESLREATPPAVTDSPTKGDIKSVYNSAMNALRLIKDGNIPDDFLDEWDAHPEQQGILLKAVNGDLNFNDAKKELRGIRNEGYAALKAGRNNIQACKQEKFYQADQKALKDAADKLEEVIETAKENGEKYVGEEQLERMREQLAAEKENHVSPTNCSAPSTPGM